MLHLSRWYFWVWPKILYLVSKKEGEGGYGKRSKYLRRKIFGQQRRRKRRKIYWSQEGEKIIEWHERQEKNDMEWKRAAPSFKNWIDLVWNSVLHMHSIFQHFNIANTILPRIGIGIAGRGYCALAGMHQLRNPRFGREGGLTSPGQ